MQAANFGDRDDRTELRRFDRPSIGSRAGLYIRQKSQSDGRGGALENERWR